MAKETDVLIAGAGPTGLVLALWLTHLGVRVRIVDKTAEPGTTSRALVMHARILEQYDQLGLAQDVIGRSLKFAAANFWVKGRRVGPFRRTRTRSSWSSACAPPGSRSSAPPSSPPSSRVKPARARG